MAKKVIAVLPLLAANEGEIPDNLGMLWCEFYTVKPRLENF